KEAPLAGWGDAFSRVTTAIIGGRGNKGSPFKKTSDIGKIKSQQAQFSLEIGQTPIEIITPTAFEIMPTHLPKKFRIEWIQPKAMKIAEQQTGRKIGYRIFLWPTNEDKPESPIAIAKSEFYSIPIKNYGTYWLQLESTDSKFTSEPKIVQSVPKTRDEENKIRQTYAREIPQAKFPSVPTIFAIPKGDRETEITFVWTNPFKQPIQFTLGREDQSKPIIDIVLPSNQLSASFTLGQGIYLWRLEDPVHNAKITLFSEIEFKIEPESKIDYFSYILDPDEEIKSDVVFYLPSGL
ncbi:MAG: hypothetical protein OXT67_08825, partial [Zetaproteobacteria bacterium]|nr:hypothetical protein [Zetaproteobacteria bacterium]